MATVGLKAYHLLIDGVLTENAASERIPIVNPADGETITYVPCASPDDVPRAVDAV
jgi:acyl-CoA reductase-like NAD-dependent aldehyde dehydrogenase